MNLSIDAKLVAEAKAAGTNMLGLLEKVFKEELRERRCRTWREENRAALEAYDRHIEQDGPWAVRTW